MHFLSYEPVNTGFFMFNIFPRWKVATYISIKQGSYRTFFFQLNFYLPESYNDEAVKEGDKN